MDLFTLHFIIPFFSLSFCHIIKGNVAWAHLCAKEKLNTDPKRISGLPIYITDDSPVIDAVRLTQRIALDMETFKVKPTSWSVPILIWVLIAMLYEMFIKFVNLFTKYQVKYCPRGMLDYAASFVLLDRLRASIALEYEPIYSDKDGFSRSAKWYDVWYTKYKEERKMKNRKI
jgi:3beta-hydroxy-delta5-steroid dehydrogenase / steroid delta-isomerase